MAKMCVLMCCISVLCSLPCVLSSTVSIVVLWEQAFQGSALSAHVLNVTNSTGHNAQLNVDLVDLTDLPPLEIFEKLCDLTSSGVVTFLSLLSCPTHSLVAGALEELAVPLVTIGHACADQPPQGRYEWEYPVREPSLTDPLKQIVTRLAWKDVILIYDEEQISRFDLAMSALAENSAMVETFKVDAVSREKDIETALLQVHRMNKEHRDFIVACSKQDVIEILQQMNRFGSEYNTPYTYQYGSSWLVLTERENLQDILTHVHNIDNVALVVTSEAEPSRNEELLQEALELVLLAVNESLLVSNVGSSTAPTICNGTRHVLVDTVWIMLDSILTMPPCSNCSEYDIMSAMWVENGYREFQLVGTWGHYGLNLTPAIFPNVKHGLNGRHLVVGTLPWFPFVGYTSESPSGYEGFCIQLLDEMATNLNFSYEMMEPSDQQWGGVINGTWTGLVGVLTQKNADIVMAPLSSSVERSQVVDFTDHFYLDYTTVLVKYADPKDRKWRLYFQPYTWQVWLMLSSTVPIGTLVTWLMSKYSPFYTAEQMKKGLALLDNAAIFIFGSCFQQGAVHVPTAQSGRFFVGFWWMYTIVVVATYSGNLIAFLTVSRTYLPFNTLDEMVAAGSHKFGIMGGTEQSARFNRSSGGAYKRVWDRMENWAEQDPEFFSTNQQVHLLKVMNENYAYIGDKTGFELELKNYCNLDTIKESFFPMKYSVALQQYSAFTATFSKEVTNIKEGGVLNKWKVQWWPRPTFCPQRDTVTEAKAVSLVDVQGAYYTLAFLISLSFVILFVEFAFHRIRTKAKSGKKTDNNKTATQNGQQNITVEENGNSNSDTVYISGQETMHTLHMDMKVIDL